MQKTKFFFYLKEYFTFSRSERNGIIILISIIGLILIVSSLLPLLLPKEPQIDIEKFRHDIALFEKSTDSIQKIQRDEPIHTNRMVVSNKPSRYKKVKLEINSADSLSLIDLPGIGPIFAHRIIKYRDLLGGFYSIDQLNEVYGLSDKDIKRLTQLVSIDTTKIKKLPVNSASFNEINRHPYISFDQSKIILKSRRKHPIQSFEQIIKLDAFTSNELTRIKPYIQYSKAQ